MIRDLQARCEAHVSDEAGWIGGQDLGYNAAEELLSAPIVDADGIAAWTDSIFNSSFPLPRLAHQGTLPSGAGYHHYPKPIVDIEFIKHDDFELFVTDEEGFPTAVLPMGPTWIGRRSSAGDRSASGFGSRPCLSQSQ